jgi:hypothetical protein
VAKAYATYRNRYGRRPVPGPPPRVANPLAQPLAPPGANHDEAPYPPQQPAEVRGLACANHSRQAE